MRSDKIFHALHKVKNRYTLCQLTAQATRKFHRPNTRIQETMNQVLERFSTVGPLESKRVAVMNTSQRQAA